jgi:hypothetical protein
MARVCLVFIIFVFSVTSASADSSANDTAKILAAAPDSSAPLVHFDQIKVFTDSVKALRGSLVSISQSDLGINTGWKTLYVEKTDVRSVELYRRDYSGGVLRGAVVGTLVGMIAFAIINVGYGISHMDLVGMGEPAPEQTVVAVWSIPAGTLVGSLLGLSHRKKVATLSPYEFWERYQRD